MVMKESRGDRIFNCINTAILLIVAVVMAYPIWFVLCASISDPDYINNGQMLFWPKGISFDGFANVLKDSMILTGYKNTILYTFFGTLMNLVVNIPAAYALSRDDLVGRKFFTFLFLFTMYFSGGLIPLYLVVQKLNLIDNPLVLIILGAGNMSNLIICRTFFVSNVPKELKEAAEIDGCGNFRLFVSIVLPLSTAIIAVMTLFFAVSHWNSYFNALIYIQDKNLKPLQIVLREILVKSEFNAQQILIGAMDGEELTNQIKLAEQIKYALIVVASIPVMLLYPFAQKYFVKGVMIGAIKG
jgi:putative aldouronate transport system permease protein